MRVAYAGLLFGVEQQPDIGHIHDIDVTHTDRPIPGGRRGRANLSRWTS